MLSVSDAEILVQLIKDVDVPAQLLKLIDQITQKPNVKQVDLFDSHFSTLLIFVLDVHLYIMKYLKYELCFEILVLSSH